MRRKLVEHGIGVDLKNLDAPAKKSVVRAPEFDFSEFKNFFQVLRVRVGLDEFKFLAGASVLTGSEKAADRDHSIAGKKPIILRATSISRRPIARHQAAA